MKKYKVALTADERQSLHGLVGAGKAAAKKRACARIAEAVEVNCTTVEQVRQRFVEQGLEAAPLRKKQDRPGRERE